MCGRAINIRGPEADATREPVEERIPARTAACIREQAADFIRGRVEVCTLERVRTLKVSAL
jgi:hypothetical protein